MTAGSTAIAQSASWSRAAFWRRDGDALLCTLCPFGCRLGDGDVGRCMVHRRSGDALETATFATSVRHVHDIERKPFYHFRPGSRALTLAAPGCTFSCDYCLNARLSQYGRDRDSPWSAAPVDPESIVEEAKTLGALIALSYSEPTLAAELTLAIARVGIEIVWKTNGFITGEAIEQVAPAVAAVNVDLKTADTKAHRTLTAAPLEPVLEALDAFAAQGTWIEISTPVIPGFNDHVESVRAMAELVAARSLDTPWHLVRFYPDYKRLTAPPTGPSTFSRAVAVAREVGLRHVYVERALGGAGRSTYCPACKSEIVVRAIGALEQIRMHGDSCANCGEPIAGRW